MKASKTSDLKWQHSEHVRIVLLQKEMSLTVMNQQEWSSSVLCPYKVMPPCFCWLSQVIRYAPSINLERRTGKFIWAHVVSMGGECGQKTSSENAEPPFSQEACTIFWQPDSLLNLAKLSAGKMAEYKSTLGFVVQHFCLCLLVYIKLFTASFFFYFYLFDS